MNFPRLKELVTEVDCALASLSFRRKRNLVGEREELVFIRQRTKARTHLLKVMKHLDLMDASRVVVDCEFVHEAKAEGKEAHHG